MLGQVKKLIEPVAGGDIGGRFGAWWNGRDYVAPVPGEDGETDAETREKPKAVKAAKVEEPTPEAPPESKAEPKAAKPEPIVTVVVEVVPEKPVAAPDADPVAASDLPDAMGGAAVRLKALETMWGAGRFAPGSAELDTRVLDELFTSSNEPGDIGFIGVDGAMLNACAERSGRVMRAAEWRAGCVERLNELAPGALVSQSEIDRPRGFENHTLEGLVTVEAFAYADHKAGLVGRAHRALSETGRWVFLDTTRHSNKTPAEAFASAWAEPQLASTDEIEELLKLAGFKSVQRTSATELVLAAAREGYAQLSNMLETAAAAGMEGREGALFLQELAWEAQSWRARMRALEGGALSVDLWVADKCERVEPLELSTPAAASAVADGEDFILEEDPIVDAAPAAAEVADQAAIVSLFD